MKQFFVITLFMLATLTWAAAQQPGSAPDPNSSQPAAQSSQAPSQSQPSTPGTADQSTATITEGCLGGSEPNYTLTNSAGTIYKLNMPAKANTAGLASHVGESVQVKGGVNAGTAGSGSIDVQAIGKGTGKCPGGGANTQSPPKK
jgi:hypothetical protein